MEALIAVIPQNLATDPRFAHVPNVVTVQHTKIACPECGEACWIGPKQRLAAESGSGRVLCYMCVIKLLEDDVPGSAPIPFIRLNPGADDLPRKKL